MIRRNLGGVMPARPEPGSAETALREVCLSAAQKMAASLEAMQLDRGLAEVLGAVREGNRYFDQAAPWKLTAEADRPALERVLYNAAECLRVTSGLLYPVMPGKMRHLRLALGLAESEVEPRFETLTTWGGLLPGRQSQDPGALFPRVDTRKPAATPAASEPADANPAASSAPSGLIDLDTFGQVKLKTAKVLSAAPVEGARKLLRLDVELGAERRQIVAGIAQSYTPEQLVGKTIVVVANLKPAVLRGVESQGMLLAATTPAGHRLVTVDGDVPSGAEIG
jgi:methionyl-tRNA synthetase